MTSAKLVLHIFFLVATVVASSRKPNIVVIVADDLGWNDVGFHGSDQIPTPNIDALAYSGLILHNYYVDPICTPSRSALMTGMHPIHTGLQSGVLVGAAPYALPLRFKLLPQFLNDLGYTSHSVGKWHLGSYRADYTPTRRGFESHVGYWTGHEDYYDHTAQELYGEVQGWGYDFRRNLSVSWSDYGTYATDIFTDEAVNLIHKHDQARPLFLYLAHLAVHSGNTYAPLQAPSDVVDRFRTSIPDEQRCRFAGMLSKLDDSVGRVVAALQQKDMLQNSIIVFTTDNGGPAAGFDDNAASNWPLRGVKDSLWEGGVRGSALLWSPLLKSRSRVAKQMMNVQDWLPTLYSAAGGRPSDLPAMDGLDMWTALSKDEQSPRNLMLHNIDDRRLFASVRVGDWKFTRGSSSHGRWDDWYGPSGRSSNLSYDIGSVLESQAAQAMDQIGMKMPDEQGIQRLRSEVSVKCTEKEPHAREPCNLLQQVCLFNVTADPCETNNLAFSYPDAIAMMESTLSLYSTTAVEPLNKPIDPRADPRYWDYTWTNYMDFLHPEEEGDDEDGDEQNRPVLITDRTIQKIVRAEFAALF